MILVAEQLDRAKVYLGSIPGAAERAMSRALNRAATSGRTEAVRAIGERYATKASSVRGMITLTTARPDRLDVAIKARSGSLALGYFPHDPSGIGTGGPGKPILTAEIKSGESKSVGGAFVANLSSGPRVMRRTGTLSANGKPAIESIFTVPLAVMLTAESVQAAVEDVVTAAVDQDLPRQIDREIATAATR